MTQIERKTAIKQAIKPFATVANSDPEAWMAAAEAAVPGVDPQEVSEAFADLAMEAEQEAAMFRATINCRTEAREHAAYLMEMLSLKGEERSIDRDHLLMVAGGHFYQFILGQGVVSRGNMSMPSTDMFMTMADWCLDEMARIQLAREAAE
jgi:hypothetical protein